MRDILNKLKIPYVVLPGNHDCLGSELSVFGEIFGALNFSFIAGKTKFLCLNTNALEFDCSTPVPDFSFIKQALSERVNGILKDEYSPDATFIDHGHARQACAEAIRLYNTRRPHCALNPKTPAEVHQAA
jgi:hypothetical protein